VDEADRFLGTRFTDGGDFNVALFKKLQNRRARKALVPFPRFWKSGPFLGQQMLRNLGFNHLVPTINEHHALGSIEIQQQKAADPVSLRYTGLPRVRSSNVAVLMLRDF
jgi:hypothetical protein